MGVSWLAGVVQAPISAGSAYFVDCQPPLDTIAKALEADLGKGYKVCNQFLGIGSSKASVFLLEGERSIIMV